jgi:hypothetical protein
MRRSVVGRVDTVRVSLLLIQVSWHETQCHWASGHNNSVTTVDSSVMA